MTDTTLVSVPVPVPVPVPVSVPSVSLDSILQDVRALERGMDLTRKEFEEQEDNSMLRDFLSSNQKLLESLVKDSKTAQVRWSSQPTKYIIFLFSLLLNIFTLYYHSLGIYDKTAQVRWTSQTTKYIIFVFVLLLNTLYYHS